MEDTLYDFYTGKDTICFNGCRIYGPVMYPHLFANYIQVYSGVKDPGFRKGGVKYPGLFDREVVCSEHHRYQPLHVLEKPGLNKI